MNAYMNISVRVLSANAQAQIKALQAQVAALEGELAKASRTGTGAGALGGAAQRRTLGAFGSQLQWTGRQLQYNWTLPLLLAGGAATKFALDNEKAMTHVKKVYGDTGDATAWFKKNQDQIPAGMTAGEAAAASFSSELDALGNAFEALSSRYGVAQKDVIDAAGAWAAAGVSGAALARSTDMSIKASILGDMDLAKATESLIAIQAQYGLSTKGLNLTLAELNAIENQTGISMQGLIEGFGRSAGVAREYGVDVRHLGAMLAALVPATGSAATAGNALKTIMSRIMAPTKDARNVMNEFGVSTQDSLWQSSTAMERLLILAGHMDTGLKKTGDSTKTLADNGYRLSDSQRAVVGSVLGSNYQVNRFLVLMRELGPAQSYYEKALNATSSRTKVFAQSTNELNAVLNSSPQRLKIMWETLKNGMADVIQPLIPYIIYLAQTLATLAQKFADLNPATQKLFLMLAVGLALIGPLTKYMGSLATLIYVMGSPVRLLARAYRALTYETVMLNGASTLVRRAWIGMLASMVTAPFKLAGAAIGWLIGRTLALGAVQRGVALVSTAWWIIVGAAPGIAATAWVGTTSLLMTRIPAMWAAMMGQVVLLQSLGFARMIAGSYLFAAMQARAWVMSAAVNTFRLSLGLMQVAFFQWIGRALGAAFMFGARLDIIMGTMWARVMAVFETFQIAFLGTMSFLRATFLAGWSGIYVGMVAISEAGGRALIAIQTLLMRAQTALVAGGTAAIAVIERSFAAARIAVWGAMQAAMTVMSTAFWTGIISIWLAGGTMLLNGFAALRGGLTTIWASIVALQRTGSLAAAAAAAGPWIAAFAAVAAIVYKFRSQLQAIWSNVMSYFANSNNAIVSGIVNAWNQLPIGITNALSAVVSTVRSAALEVYSWFSYLNPFAHHSPSLVENVTKGMGQVRKHLAKTKEVGRDFNTAHKSVEKYGTTVSRVAEKASKASGPAPKAARQVSGGINALIASSNKADQASTKAAIAKISPGAAAESGKLAAKVAALTPKMNALAGAVKAQEGVVAAWQKRLDAANAALDRQQKKLDALTKVQQKWQDLLDGAQTRLSNFANAPIKGMGEMNDAIFQNEMAQKKLRLEMMKMSDAGQSLDDIKSKIDAINGAQEMLRGQKASLRAAGAGSDVLKAYDDQIAALEKQKVSNNKNAQSLQNMSDELDKLQKKGERLDLENSLKFDPLTHQIEAASSALHELPFDQIMAGVRGAQADIKNYQGHLDAATKAVNNQQAAVDAATAARDRVQKSLDREQKQLDRTKAAYDAVSQAISDMTSRMGDAASAASSMQQARDAAKAAKKAKKDKAAQKAGYVSPALQNFRDAKGGNFADVGGDGIPMRKNWKNQGDQIQKLTDRLAKQSAGAMSGLNPFEPIKKYWGKFQTWVSNAWSNVAKIGSDFFSKAFAGVSFGDASGKAAQFGDRLRKIWAGLYAFVNNNVIKPIKAVWDLFWPDLERIAKAGWAGIKSMWDNIAPELGRFTEEIAPLMQAIKNVWFIVKLYLGWIILRWLFVGKIIASVIGHTIKPILDTLGNIFENALQVIRGVVQVIVGILTLDLGKTIAGLGNIFSGLGGIIGQALWGAVKIVWGIIEGLVGGVWGYFLWLGDKLTGGWMSKIFDGIVKAAKWLYDVMVGHSIIPDLIDAIWHYFGLLATLGKWVFGFVLKPIFAVFKLAWTVVKGLLKLWWAGIQLEWRVLKTLAGWLWNFVLKPIWTVVKALWDNFIKPAFKLWWAGIQLEWAALKALGGWLWDNVLKPIWGAVKKVWSLVKAALGLWWAGIKMEWRGLKKIAGWVWDHVLSPIWDAFKKVWDKYIGPFLGRMWTGMKREWAGMKIAGKWIWDHVLSPVWDKIKDLWGKVGPELRLWWGRVKNAWSAIKAAGKWIWDNVLKPVWDKVQDLWVRVKTGLGRWWGGIKDAWAALKDIGKWFKTNVMDKVFDVVTSTWTRIKDWLVSHADMLTGPMKGIVNAVIGAVDAVIGGLNKVSDILPGVSWHIDTIPKLAQGGPIATRQANRGFKTTGARAIVGEGKANYPEFVIPTDPTHRHRARGLLAAASAKISGGARGAGTGIKNATQRDAHGVPMFSIGGWLGGAWNGVKSLGSKIAKLPKDATGKVMNSILNKASDEISGIGWKPVEIPPRFAIDKLRGWVSDTDSGVNQGIKQNSTPKGGNVPVSDPSNPAGHNMWRGGEFSNLFIAHLKKAEQLAGATMSVMQGGFRPYTPYSGASHEGDAVDIRVNDNLIRAMRRVGIAAGDRTGLGDWAAHVHAVPGPDAGYGAGSAPWQWDDYMARGGMSQSLSSPWGLKSGGIALASRGPTPTFLGDGRYDEAVVPLPHGWRNSPDLIGGSGGDTVVNIYGDLSFPNIEKGADAEELIRNLELLAGD